MEKESMILKIERILALCNPPVGYAPVEEYDFDIERLRKIDNLRHDCAHRSKLPSLETRIESNLHFLEKTGLYIISLLNSSLGITISEEYLVEVVQTQGLP